MESRRILVYVDIFHIWKIGEAILMRESDWFPRLRPRFKKLFREDINE